MTAGTSLRVALPLGWAVSTPLARHPCPTDLRCVQSSVPRRRGAGAGALAPCRTRCRSASPCMPCGAVGLGLQVVRTPRREGCG